MACVLDRIQPGSSFLPAECFELFDGSSLADVVPENGDIDVFRKPGNQAVGFG